MLKRVIKFVIVCFVLILLSAGFALLLFSNKQSEIVQYLVKTANSDFPGELKIEGSHIALFANFPYISIDLEGVEVYENKTQDEAAMVVNIGDVYVGFDFFSVLGGNFKVKSIKLANGYIRAVQDSSGEINLSSAFASDKPTEEVSSDFHLDLARIKIENIQLSKLNMLNGLMISANILDAAMRFKAVPDHLLAKVDAEFQLTVLRNNDSTFIKNKNISIQTGIDYFQTDQKLLIEPSKLMVNNASFGGKGMVDIDNNFDMDLSFYGEKPDFDLFIAFSPEELIPTLKRYRNRGNIYFDATIKGKSAFGYNPKVDINFGCENAYFSNSRNEKTIDELEFKGYFTTGDSGTLSTSEFGLLDFSSKPEAGIFKGQIIVKNFESPDIDMKVDAALDLPFLADFFELDDLEELKGQINIKMNFHDIVDLDNPELTLDNLNQSYFTELVVEGLAFNSAYFHQPLNGLDMKLVVDGEKATIHHLRAKVGNSDMSVSGTVSDLPQIVHHGSQNVDIELFIQSSLLDLQDLTNVNDSIYSFNERIKDLNAHFVFHTSAKELTESPNIPNGRFEINNFRAAFENYPHIISKLEIEVLVEENAVVLDNFSLIIDDSDFYAKGKLANYQLWFDENPNGDTKLDFELNSAFLKLGDLLTYQGEKYLPEDYKNEEISQFFLKGNADLHFKDSLYASDFYVDELKGKMKIHPLKFEQFGGRFHIEEEHLTIENFRGKLGESSFKMNMNYYYGDNELLKKRNNQIDFYAPFLHFDEISNYQAPAEDEKINHDSVFNIYTLPFTDFKCKAKIDQLRYHKKTISELYSELRITPNHYIYLDTLRLLVADGEISGSGYFNGEDPSNIYLSPAFQFRQLDIDKLMLKFDNFGQDEFVSDNLHGKLSGKIWGNIHMHTDMVPMMDKSEIHIDFEVTEGRLDNYGPMHAMADYFKDKNLNRIGFDTLKNKIDMENGNITIPNMSINTTLGFIAIAGKQDKEMNMDYTVAIPLKLVGSAALSKLFGRSKENTDPAQEDEIIRQDSNRKTSFINLKVTGTPENYKISTLRKRDMQ